MQRAQLRSLLIFAHDMAASACAWSVAFLLRFNFDIPHAFQAVLVNHMGWVLCLQAAIFYSFGLYRGIWRFASLPDLKRIALAAGASAVAVLGMSFMFSRAQDIPRSVIVLDPMLLILIMGGSRFLYRAWMDGHLIAPRQLGATPVFVLGAGDAADALLRDLARDVHWNVVGLFDDDPSKQGLRLHGVPVLGSLKRLAVEARGRDVHHAIIAMPGASVGARRGVAEQAADAGLQVLTVPALGDVLSGKVSVTQIRLVELEDLLGRDCVQLDNAGLTELLGDNVIVVTGAGGSIGSELCRQIAIYGPKCLIMIEQSELALYKMEQEFSRSKPDLAVLYIIADVRNSICINELLLKHRPKIVFHAAAYKHVPLMEGRNAWQAVQNNVLGTRIVAEASIACGASKFVLVSTDKAVNPTNVMGATKRLAELTCQALQNSDGCRTRFVTVRFGNVLGSSGSVIPKFREQIAQGGPVTVTHKDIVRYFMLIPEAAQLVLQAGLMGSGGEIFVLDMGEPVKIFDLAKDMIRLSGFSVDEIPIVITGLRAGEKLYEELLTDCETTLPTHHPKLRVAKATGLPDGNWLSSQNNWLEQKTCDYDDVKRSLKTWVPEYFPAIQ